MKYILRIFSISVYIFLLTIINQSFASIRSFNKQKAGVLFQLDKGQMFIKICNADIIEVKYSVLNGFSNTASLIIDKNWKINPAYSFKEQKNDFVITTSRLIIIINKSNNAIAYYNNNKVLILSEASENKSMSNATIAGIKTYNCTSVFDSPKQEALYGLGCHPVDSGSINYKGRNQDLAIKYLTGAIPVLLSTNGYGLMWDNYAASMFYGAEDNNSKFKYVSESGKQVDYYFFYGPEFDHIIDLYRTATGRAPMFAKWAYGLFQSQDRYMSENEILSVKDGYRKNHIPVDVIVQDWYYWDPLPIGSHIMQPQRYPHPKQLVDALHKENIHAMISIWPVFGKGTNNYDALNKMGGLTDITWDNVVTHTFDTYYDAHNTKARNLYWQQARDSLIKRYDWDAWWIDQCEPDNGALLDARRQSNFSIGKGIDYFNTYSLQHTKGVYEGWRKDIPGKRAFFLVRQSFAGEQRNAATLWSSDITTTFDAFKIQIPEGINTCVSGIPYWTSDIGGYHYHWTVPDWSKPEFRELFTRWFQFGTFCPVFRIHGKGERALFSNNWDPNTKTVLLKFDKLRYRLLPYIYSLAGMVTNNNYTIMRSLAFDFRKDSNVYNIQDQYMFGPAFLVNPVTQQMYTGNDIRTGDKTRKLYLPANTKWFDFWTGNVANGGSTIDAKAPIDIMPLYVKQGSIIPMGDDIEYATQHLSNKIELRIYPGANGSFTYYEDENDNYNYEKGKYSTIQFYWNDVKRELTISEIKGNYTGLNPNHIFNVIIVNGPHGAGPEITTQIDKKIAYNGKKLQVKL